MLSPRSPWRIAIADDSPAFLAAAARYIESLPGYVLAGTAPSALDAPATTIESGQNSTALALYADEDLPEKTKLSPLLLIGEATGVRKEVTGEAPKIIGPGELIAFTEQSDVTIEPGRQAKLTASSTS